MEVKYNILGYRRIENSQKVYQNFPDMEKFEVKTDITEFYKIEYPELNVTVEMPIFNQVGNVEYLEKSISNRFESEKRRIDELKAQNEMI